MSATVLLALVTAAAVGLSSGYVGSLMVLRRMALVGDALSHVALPGLAVGILAGFDPVLGALAFVLAAAWITWWLERATRLAVDALVGVLFVLALSVGVLLTPNPDLLEALFGDVTRVGPLSTVVSVVVTAGVVVVTRRIYRPSVLAIISEDLAASAGIDVRVVSLVYLTLVSVVVAVGIQVVGTLLAGALVIVPAVAAKLLGRSLRSFAAWSAAFGVAAALAGTALAFAVDVPAGPLAVFVGVAIFVAALAARAVAAPRAARHGKADAREDVLVGARDLRRREAAGVDEP